MNTTTEFYKQASALERRIMRSDREQRRKRKQHGHKGARKLPQICRDEICWLHRNGKSNAQIARMRYVSEITVRRILRENGISRKAGRPVSKLERWRRNALKDHIDGAGLKRTGEERRDRTKLTRIQKMGIRMDIERGHTRAAIANAYGVGKHTVARIGGYRPPSAQERHRRYGKLILTPGQRPRYTRSKQHTQQMERHNEL